MGEDTKRLSFFGFLAFLAFLSILAFIIWQTRQVPTITQAEIQKAKEIVRGLELGG